MNTAELKEYLAADLYRHKGRKGTAAMLKTLRKNRSFKITFWLRLAQWGRQSAPPGLKQLLRWQYRRVCRRYCVDLPETTQIGKGLIIYHCYGLVVNGKSLIGDNVMLAHQITLADEQGKAPIIGDRVRIAPGAKVIGGVEIGEGVVVGANCVVVKDVPPHTVTVGIPNRVIPHPYDDDAERYYWPPTAWTTKEPLSAE